MKEFFMGLGALILIIALAWLFMFNDIFMSKVYKPAQAEIERNTFEESKSYVQGSITELSSYYLSYRKATGEHKQALKEIVLLNRANYLRLPNLPEHLRSFLQELDNE